MATSKEYIEYVVGEVQSAFLSEEYEAENTDRSPEITFKKMFGEYMVYVNNSPVFTVCDNTVFVKKYAEIQSLISAELVGFPYDGAKEHYIVDVENTPLTAKLLSIILKIPKRENKRAPK